MTRLWDQGFEPITPSGTAITTGNSLYGAMVGSGTGTKVSDSSFSHSGGLSAKFNSHTGAGNTAAGAYVFTDRAEFHYRCYFMWDANPAAIVLAFLVKSNDNANTVAQVVIDTAGALRLRDAAASTLSTSAAITPGTVVELEIDCTNDGTTEHIRARAQWGSHLDTGTYDWDSGDQVTSVATCGRMIEGSSTVQEINIWVDDSSGDDAAQPGPLVPSGSTPMVWSKAVTVG